MIDILLISPEDVKAYSDINYNVDATLVASAIRTAQSLYLYEILGQPLFDKIMDLVATSRIADDENIQYKTMLDDYIQPYLTAKATAEICVPISLKIRNIGVSQDSDTNINGVSMDSIKYLRDTAETASATFANRLSDYIYSNRKAIDEAHNLRRRKRYANVNLWLGDLNDEEEGHCEC